MSSDTAETAPQEILALVIGQSLGAEARLAVAEAGAVESVRISLVKVLEELRWVWRLAARLGETPGVAQREQIALRLHAALWSQVTARRRGRSPPRALGQPVRSWPRKLKNQS